MQKTIVIFAIFVLISQAYIFPRTYLNPTIGGGSNSPPGAGSDGEPNPYYSQLPTPGAPPIDPATKVKFENFKKANGKNYKDPNEESYRRGIFIAKLKAADDFNKLPNQGWTQGTNELSDQTDAEISKQRLMVNLPPPPRIQSTNSPVAAASYPVAGVTAKDWTSSFSSWSVKNQGQCGSCWAFSTVGVIEANVAIKKRFKTPGRYSEEQLVDCATSTHGCYGCNGGWPAGALRYIGAAGGIATNAAYPYTAGNGYSSACRSSSVAKTQYLKSTYAKVISSTQSAVLTALNAGTISVCVYADNGWFSYASGIYGGCATSTTSINHAVVLVGVDVDGNYKIRNSWGTTWGEYGYMRIKVTNDCGILLYPYQPILL